MTPAMISFALYRVRWRDLAHVSKCTDNVHHGGGLGNETHPKCARITLEKLVPERFSLCQLLLCFSYCLLVVQNARVFLAPQKKWIALSKSEMLVPILQLGLGNLYSLL